MITIMVIYKEEIMNNKPLAVAGGVHGAEGAGQRDHRAAP